MKTQWPWERSYSSLPQHEPVTQLADVNTDNSACQCHWRDTRLHAPVKSKCWEPVEPTLIHALCAEDICITEHTLAFRF